MSWSVAVRGFLRTALQVLLLLYGACFALAFANATAVVQGGPYHPNILAQFHIPVSRSLWATAWELFLSILHGHFGQGFQGQSIWAEVGPALRYSEAVLVWAVPLTFAIGLFKGFYDASTELTPLRYVSQLLSSVIELIPDFVLVLAIFLVLFALNLAVPGGGGQTDGWVIGVLLSIPPGLYLARMVTLRLFDLVDRPFVQVATSKGLSLRRIRYHHLLGNLWALIFVEVPGLWAMVLSNLVVLDWIFVYYGVGWVFLSAVGADSILYNVPVQGGEAVSIIVLLILSTAVVNSAAATWRQGRYAHADVGGQSLTLKRHRPSIVAGLVILAGLAAAGVLRHVIDLHSAHARYPLVIVGGHYYPAPTTWAPGFPLGTNRFGQDLLALALSGAIPTLMDTALLAGAVLVLGGLMAAAAVLLPRWGQALRFLFGMFQLVPPLFALVLVLGPLTPDPAVAGVYETLYFGLILGVEAVRVAGLLEGHAQQILAQPYVEAAHAGGAGAGHLFRVHLWYGLRALLLEYYFVGAARVLILVSQLGLFGIFPGAAALGTQTNQDLGGVAVLPSFTNWGAQLGGRALAMASNPLSMLAPLTGILLLALAVNLIARGIRGMPSSLRLVRRDVPESATSSLEWTAG